MSYSRMRVDLAVQVLSSSVANTLEHFGSPETKETENFVRHFDRFFDCLNVRCVNEGYKKQEEALAPYKSPDDSRLKWLEEDFLGYIDSWEHEVQDTGRPANKKRKMMLSSETVEGIRITVKSFVDMTRCLLSQPGSSNLLFLSERICQDPLENYFGQQRSREGRCDNPIVKEALQNAVAFRAQHSIKFDRIQGNCRRKRNLFDCEAAEMIDDTPLPKRGRSMNV